MIIQFIVKRAFAPQTVGLGRRTGNIMPKFCTILWKYCSLQYCFGT